MINRLTTWFFAFLLVIALTSCINYSDRPEIIGVEYPERILPSHCFDENGAVSLKKLDLQQPLGNLDSKGFTLLNWNSYKGKKKGWLEDLERLGEGADIIVLQEGHLTEILKDRFYLHDFKWNIANAFTYNGVPTGTLTASRIFPEARCSLKTMEPVSGIPKSVLLTRYSLSGTNKKLLLVNLHLVNFTFENSSYQEQLQTVAMALDQHDGPYILAGDFNTWNKKRLTILNKFIDQLRVKTVTFADDKRSTFMSNHVDHIYYHGLKLVTSESKVVSTSDHNPMIATFRFQEDY